MHWRCTICTANPNPNPGQGLWSLPCRWLNISLSLSPSPSLSLSLSLSLICSSILPFPEGTLRMVKREMYHDIFFHLLLPFFTLPFSVDEWTKHHDLLKTYSLQFHERMVFLLSTLLNHCPFKRNIWSFLNPFPKGNMKPKLMKYPHV